MVLKHLSAHYVKTTPKQSHLVEFSQRHYKHTHLHVIEDIKEAIVIVVMETAGERGTSQEERAAIIE